MIGLSAPQVQHSLQLIAFQIRDPIIRKQYSIAAEIPLTFLVNPVLTLKGPTVTDYEFCESVPKFSALVERSKSIQVKAFDLKGNPVVKEYNGLLARIIQHEVDHLGAILFTDCMQKGTFRHNDYVGKYDMYCK